MKSLLPQLTLLLSATGLISASSMYINVLNSPYAGYGYLGAVVGPSSTSNDLGNDYNYDLFTGTNYSAPGAVPAAIGNAYSGQDAEASIWQIDGSNNITAQWINTDGSAVNAVIWYLASANGLGLTGNFADFDAAFPGAVQITLKYVPSGPSGHIEVFNNSTSADLGAISDQSLSPTLRFGLTTTGANDLLVTLQATPEPGSLGMIAVGIGGLLVAGRRRWQR
jgi:hypothetical protein